MNPVTWLPAAGFPNYSVSSNGDVRREKSFCCKEARIIKQYTDKKGYQYVCPSVGGKAFTIRVHRLVAATFFGDLGDKTVNHIDLNKSNNKVSNLELMSGAENTRHAIKNGHISLSGAKIDYEKAVAIKIAKALGQTSAALAAEFGISKRSIDRVICGACWHTKPADAITKKIKNP